MGGTVKGVFEISGNSRYDDAITERYHFPSNYLSVARELTSDWIVYREARVSGGRMAYIAAACVERIDADPSDPSHFYARVRDYLEFDQPVPYRDGGGRFAERFLREMARPGDAGRSLRGKSVRGLEDEDFVAIVNAGLAETLDPENRIRLELDAPPHRSGDQSSSARSLRGAPGRADARQPQDPGRKLPQSRSRRLRQYLCGHRAQDRQWRRQGRSPSRPHLVGCEWRS
jgi:hypothetical protein